MADLLAVPENTFVKFRAMCKITARFAASLEAQCPGCAWPHVAPTVRGGNLTPGSFGSGTAMPGMCVARTALPARTRPGCLAELEGDPKLDTSR
jgi:hypothetical protein